MARRGRKSKWEDVSRRLEDVRKWRQAGATEAQIAKALGISHDTFYTYKKQFPEFSEVLKQGSDILALDLRGALVELAKGGRKIRSRRVIKKKDAQGQVIETQEITDIKELPPNAFAAQKVLGNLDRTWHDDPDGYELKKAELELKKAKAEKESEWD